jgi:hypothetical protein
LSATQLDASSTVAGTFVYAPASGTVLTAGTHTLSVTFTPTDTTDYTTATATVQLTVNKATPAITWATPAAITYPTALSATQLDASSTVAGTFVYSPASGTVLTAGAHTLSVTLTPTDTTDYTTATATVQVIVVNPVKAVLTTPTPGSVLAGSSVAFTWTAGSGPTAYQLYLGTTGVGSYNLYDSGSTTATTKTVNGLPTNGVTVFARLYQLINGVWQTTDYTYTEAGTLVKAVLTTPTPGSVLAGSSVAFTWTAGAGPTEYQLWLGTTGAGSYNIYDSGATTATTKTVSGLPTNGVPLYARLDQLIDGVWQHTDYTYTEAGTPVPAALTSPAPGSVLTGSSVTFTWSPGGGPIAYQLWLGTTQAGSDNLYYSSSTKATTATVTVPTNGATVFARLYSLINGTWLFTDYTYTEAGTLVPATLTSPAPGSVLTGSSVAFTWSGAGPAEYQLYLGTTGVGSYNLYSSGVTTAKTKTVSALPTNGVTVFARLYQLIDGVWQHTDYTYTEAGTLTWAALTSPTPGSVLAGSSVAFTWTGGAGPAAYQLYLGTTGVGSYNLYDSGSTTATTETVNGLPTTGVTVYARLYQLIDGVWQHTDYTYTAQ